MDDDPKTWFDPLLFLFALVLAAWGGLVSFLQRARRGDITFNLIGLLVEVTIAAFAGLVAFFMVQWLGGKEWLSAMAAALFGHWGGQGLALLEKAAITLMETRMGIKFKDHSDDGDDK